MTVKPANIPAPAIANNRGDPGQIQPTDQQRGRHTTRNGSQERTQRRRPPRQRRQPQRPHRRTARHRSERPTQQRCRDRPETQDGSRATSHQHGGQQHRADARGPTIAARTTATRPGAPTGIPAARASAGGGQLRATARRRGGQLRVAARWRGRIACRRRPGAEQLGRIPQPRVLDRRVTRGVGLDCAGQLAPRRVHRTSSFESGAVLAEAVVVPRHIGRCAQLVRREADDHLTHLDSLAVQVDRRLKRFDDGLRLDAGHILGAHHLDGAPAWSAAPVWS